jgi:LacI family transcriptional regulator
MIPRVALLIETTRTYTREILAGVRRYVAEHGPWSTFVELRSPDSLPPPWLKNWQGDGILTRTFTPAMNRAVSATGLPAVELRSTSLPHDRPFVGVDNGLIGQAVAEHFLNRGYRHFAVYGLTTETFFIQRVQNFVTRLQQRGLPCTQLTGSTSDRPADWEASQTRLIAQLRSLPKPVGIFAANDQLGVHLLDACLRAGLAVPEEIAVVGCENDETLCTLATPPLTSVELDGPRVGYEAARLLDQLMRTTHKPKSAIPNPQPSEARQTSIGCPKGSAGTPRQSPILIPPRQIITRESSDDLVITDPLVARASRLIRQRSHEGLTVDDLCLALNASRSTLERRMKAALGRTPKDEILRLRFRDVERLLLTTDLTLDQIAERTGFTHASYFQAAFRARYDLPPGTWRQARLP